MRIVINGVANRTGGGLTYLKNIIKWFPILAPDDDFIILINKGFAHGSHIQNVHFVEAMADAASPLKRLLWEQKSLPRMLRELDADVYFSLNNILPACCHLSCRTIVLVQNVAPFYELAYRGLGIRDRCRLKALKYLTVKSMRQANKIVFLSNTSYSILTRYITANECFHTVISLGSRKDFLVSNAKAIETFLLRKGIAPGYLLCVSDFYPYKMILATVHAIKNLASDIKAKLVIVGAPAIRHYYNRVMDYVLREGLSSQVLIVGSVPYEEIPYWYAGAALILCPSICENNPHVIYEAISANKPFLAANTSVMKEIGGKLGFYVDVSNLRAYVMKIEYLLRNIHDVENKVRLYQEFLEQTDWRRICRDLLRFIKS